MDELSEYSSEILEFLPTQQLGKQCKAVEACVSTDLEASCQNQDKSVETTLHSHTSTQTELSTSIDNYVDDQKLAMWLKKMYPAVEAQLLKGTTPLNDNGDNVDNPITSFTVELNIQIYQKITVGGPENSQGIATWLSVHTNNAPMLVVSTKSPHNNWCDHLQQTLKLFVPKRIRTGNLVGYAECKSVPLKACLDCMSTNTYNKSIFAGSTLDGDIHVWSCRSNNRVGNNDSCANSVSLYEVDELCCASSPYGSAVVLCWSSVNRLLSFHSNGFINSWAVGKELIMENNFQLKVESSTITAAVSLSSNTFMVGVKDGSIYLCTITSFSTMRKQMEIVPLKKHSFMISTLIKTVINGCQKVISGDISGQVVCHSVPLIEEENQDVTRIPLPFKTAIACSKDGHVIYSPGSDGSLECYNIISGVHTVVEGALRGKGNFIACSDNGNWIITGLYADDFQIFYIEN